MCRLDKDDHAYSVETKGVSTTTAELEKISEKIVHDSLVRVCTSKWHLLSLNRTVCRMHFLYVNELI